MDYLKNTKIDTNLDDLIVTMDYQIQYDLDITPTQIINQFSRLMAWHEFLEKIDSWIISSGVGYRNTYNSFTFYERKGLTLFLLRWTS